MATRARTNRCVAFIADVVRSRSFQGRRRARLQERLATALDEINARYQAAILARFVITVGDEFQGLIHDPRALPDVVWDLERRLAGVEIRIGLGCGRLETRLHEAAVGMDGSAWHHAREAVVHAKKAGAYGGVFRGFGEADDRILDGFARLLRHLRERFTHKQRATLDLLRQGNVHTQAAVAQQLALSRQAIHKRARAAGWDAYREGEHGWRTALAGFVYSSDWKR